MYRDEDTGKIDWEIIFLFTFIGLIISGITAIAIVGIRHDIKRSKLPEVIHYKTLLDNSLNVEIWRKDRRDLNDTIIIVENYKIKVNSIGNIIEIPIEEGKVSSYEIEPVYRVFKDAFSSTLTNRIRKYIILIKLEKRRN